jgi:hypothetical protein
MLLSLPAFGVYYSPVLHVTGERPDKLHLVWGKFWIFSAVVLWFWAVPETPHKGALF